MHFLLKIIEKRLGFKKKCRIFASLIKTKTFKIKNIMTKEELEKSRTIGQYELQIQNLKWIKRFIQLLPDVEWNHICLHEKHFLNWEVSSSYMNNKNMAYYAIADEIEMCEQNIAFYKQSTK